MPTVRAGGDAPLLSTRAVYLRSVNKTEAYIGFRNTVTDRVNPASRIGLKTSHFEGQTRAAVSGHHAAGGHRALKTLYMESAFLGYNQGLLATFCGHPKRRFWALFASSRR